MTLNENIVKNFKVYFVINIGFFIIISVFIQTKVSPEKIPSIFGYKPFIVLSGSMEAEIYKGDLAIVKNVDATTLKKNDIIAFRDEEGYVVTHRIVKVVNDIDGLELFNGRLALLGLWKNDITISGLNTSLINEYILNYYENNRY